MDRDVYLILVGAGISLVSSLLTLFFQFILGLISENIQSKREEKKRQSKEIREALIDKSLPIVISPGNGGGGILKQGLPPEDTRIKTSSMIFNTIADLWRTSGGARRERIALLLKQPWFWISAGTGVLVFIAWIVYVFFI